MMTNRMYVLSIIGSSIIVLAVSYGMAMLQEPQAHWLWCTMLKLC